MIDIEAIDAENLRCPPGCVTTDLIDMLRKDNAVGRLVAVVRAAQRFADDVIDVSDYLDEDQAAAADELLEALAEVGAGPTTGRRST